MPTARDGLSTIAVDGKIYTIGGLIEPSPLTVLSMVEVYDPTTDTWENKADMPTRRFAHATAVVNGKIYVIGGLDIPDDAAEDDPGRDLFTVEVYDPHTDTWERRTDMPTPRELANNAPVVNGKSYVIGGWQQGVQVSGESGVATVEVYDPAADTWEQGTDMPTPRGAFGISKVDGKIYVIGGGPSRNPFLPTVEMYDPTTDVWGPKADMPTRRRSHSASAVNGIIYAIGGWDDTRYLSTVEAYDTGVGIRIQAISPQEGSLTGGEPIAMSGTGFPPDAIVTIGGKPLTNLEIINDTVISGLTPPGTLGEHTLLITSPSYPMSDLFYQTTFLYPSPVPPTITAITPNRGPLTGGQVATIVGNGFIPGVSVVILDVEASVTAMTPTAITFTTPPHTEGAKFVLVRNVDRKVGFLDGGYTYVDVEFPPEDLNLDGVVNLFDLVLVASQFGLEGDLNGDVNGDGSVDLFDLVRVASHFGETAVGAAPPGADWGVPPHVADPERVRHALAELEAIGEQPRGVVVAIAFLRAWLAKPLVTETMLLPNYPNPFNPETWIPYQLATDAAVQVRIYDIKGALVRQLDLGHQKAGYYVNRERAAYWDGRDDSGERVSSGLYFYQLRAGDYSATKRMVILK
jgi:hypothetical protein